MANFVNINAQQMQFFKDAFSLFDKTNLGVIPTGEIGSIMKQLGVMPSPQELQEMIDEVDEDGNGEIDFNEFVGMMSKRMREEETNDEVQMAFKVFDVDKDGFVSRDDIKIAMAKMGASPLTDAELDDLFEKCDLDRDNKFDYEEFAFFITPK